MVPWCLIPTKQMTIGLSLGSTLRTVVWWHCWTFDTCCRFWHKSRHHSAWWASSTLLELACVPTTVTLSGFRRSLCGLLSWWNPLPQDPNTLDIGKRSLSCTRHHLSKRIALLRPSTFLWFPFRLVRHHFSSKRLMVWSNYLQELYLAHWQNLLVEKAKQKRVHCRGWSYVLLKRLWQCSQLTHSLL